MKRSVLEIPDWPGWDTFMEYYEGADQAPYPEDSRLYFTLLFESGCRREEVIKIRPDMIKYNEEAIVIQNVPVLKKKKRTTRNVIIKRDDKNPLADHLLKYLADCDTDYLLPGLRPFTREKIRDRHVSQKTVWNRISELSPDLWPHALRGYRASMLVHERGFTVQNLVSWFDWSSANMAVHYTRTKDLAHNMGIMKLPT